MILHEMSSVYWIAYAQYSGLRRPPVAGAVFFLRGVMPSVVPCCDQDGRLFQLAMAILVTEETRLVVAGISGRYARDQVREMLA